MIEPDALRHLLKESSEPESTRAAGTLAAVLVPLADRGGTWHLILTRRSYDLTSHGGEISFPGGKADPGEEGRTAALREAEEELGIPAREVEVLGRLPAVATVVTGFAIEPWVGIIPAGELEPNPDEIAEVLEVPMTDLAEARRDQRFIRAGRMFSNPTYHVGGNIIWGATARIVSQLLELLETRRD